MAKYVVVNKNNTREESGVVHYKVSHWGFGVPANDVPNLVEAPKEAKVVDSHAFFKQESYPPLAPGVEPKFWVEANSWDSPFMAPQWSYTAS